MNILFLSHRVPYPPNKGDKIRSFNEIKFLSKKHSIFLCTTLDYLSDQSYAKKLEEYCTEVHTSYFNKWLNLIKNIFSTLPFSIANFHDESLQRKVDSILKEKKIDVIYCFCSSMAEYVFKSDLYQSSPSKDIKRIMDYVDLDSDKWRQYSLYSKFPLNILHRIEQSRLLKYEIRVNKFFDVSIFAARRELDVFQSLYPEAKNLVVLPNGVDSSFFKPKAQLPPHNTMNLVFTGVMDYFANEDGVIWFCDHIFPMIRREFPEVRFYIVGDRPTKKVKRLSSLPGVIVIGFVEDIREYYWLADICIIPLRIARGLQNKVLEAMSTGNAIVATSNATNGIVCHENNDIVIADGVEEFANAVITLLKDQKKIKSLGEEAMKNVQAHYSWDENLSKLAELIG